MFGFTILVGTRSALKDSKTRKIRTSGDISAVPTKKKAILGLGYRVRVRVLGLGVREINLGINCLVHTRIVNQTCVCLCLCVRVRCMHVLPSFYIIRSIQFLNDFFEMYQYIFIFVATF